MTVIRIFTDQTLQQGIKIVINNVHYIVNVMRRQVGDEVFLVNGKNGEFLSKITKATKKEIELFIFKKTKEYKKSKFLGLIFAPIQKIDLLVKSAVEIGVSNFLPFKSEYCQYNLKNTKIDTNIIEAIEQCERTDFPVIEKQKSLKETLDSLNEKNDIVLFCEERTGQNHVEKILRNIDKNKNVYALIGCEGGFSNEEKQLIKSYNFTKSVSLGENILRAETACTAILSLIKFNIYQ